MPLAVTVAPLGSNIRAVLDRLATTSVRYVQLSAAQPGTRPRDLDQSARRDLFSTLRRLELMCSGIDLWIPAEHFAKPDTIDRAVGAMTDALQLAADLGRCPLGCALPRAAESATSGEPGVAADDSAMGAVIETLVDAADRLGVAIADHGLPLGAVPDVGIGIDPAALLANGEDPAATASTLDEPPTAARLCDLYTSGMRGPVGPTQQGRLDLVGYQVGLHVAGYRGPVVIDARQWSEPWSGVAQSVHAWREVQP